MEKKRNILTVETMDGIKFEDLKAPLNNMVKELHEKWAIEANKKIYEVHEAIKKQFGEDLKNLEKQRKGSIASHKKHANQVETYLKQLNKLLARKL